jgi:hypothetical protein
MALKIWLPFNGDLKEQGLSNNAQAANINATFSDIGLNGSCINFNGTNSYISLSNPLTSANTEFSICAWVKLTVSDSTQTIFTARNATGKGLALFRLSGGKFRFDDGVQTSFSLTHTSTANLGGLRINSSGFPKYSLQSSQISKPVIVPPIDLGSM